MSSEWTGQCSCGSVKYACSTPPKFTLICQCRQCQRITGSGHAAQFAVPINDTEITGNAKTFGLTSDAGNSVTSAFCDNCGNPIYKTTSMMPHLLFFHAATLDDPGKFEPETVVYSASAQPWDHVDSSIKRQR